MGQAYILDHLLLLSDQKKLSESYESSKVIGTYDDSTLKLFGALQNAYNYFKQKIFQNSLTPVILTLNRKAHSMGYYKPQAWLNEQEETIPEINISPATLHHPAIEVMQTLVHEMAHHYHYLYGKPGTRGYHNCQFAQIMFSIGLVCSSTGKPGGKKTGHRMSDYIMPGGLFEMKFKEMSEAYTSPFRPFERQTFFVSHPNLLIATVDKNKTKYICTKCNTAVWGKPNLNIICADCNTKLVTIKPAK